MDITTPLFFVSIVSLVTARPTNSSSYDPYTYTTYNPYSGLSSTSSSTGTWGMSTWVWVIVLSELCSLLPFHSLTPITVSIAFAGIILLYWIVQLFLNMTACCSCQKQNEGTSIYQNAMYAGDRVVVPVHDQPTRHNVALPGYEGSGRFTTQQESHYKPDVYPLRDLPPLATKRSSISSGWESTGSYPGFSRQYDPSRQFHG